MVLTFKLNKNEFFNSLKTKIFVQIISIKSNDFCKFIFKNSIFLYLLNKKYVENNVIL